MTGVFTVEISTVTAAVLGLSDVKFSYGSQLTTVNVEIG